MVSKQAASVSFDNNEIQDALIEKLFHYFIDEYDWMARVKEQISERVDKAFASGVEKQIQETVVYITKQGFEREYTKVLGGFGEASETTTISKEMERLIGSYWSETVSKDGKPSKSYGAVTRAEYTLVQVTGDDFMKGLRQEIVNSAAKIKDGFRDQIRAQLDVTLGNLFNVQSSTDKKENRKK